MDETDFKIINILRKDSRESFVYIAKALGVTEGTVRNRVKRLAREGVIKGFTIDYQAPVEGLVILKSSLKNSKALLAKLKEFSTNIFEISGEYDIAAIVEAQNIKELNKKVDRIRALKGVSGTNTAIKLH
ncbi:MAG: Lrp/AsnC family transcriptional regulator [Candidatus Aenigmarchaeota archaeon]|nr:Lrp/AsnC family transcriptional regulator [Candidatus Aenigmarchaeota archaeon]